MPRANRGEFVRPEIGLPKNDPMTKRLLEEAAARQDKSLARLILDILHERDDYLQGKRPRPLWLPADTAADVSALEREVRELINLIRGGALPASSTAHDAPPSPLDQSPEVPTAAASAGAVWAKKRKPSS